MSVPASAGELGLDSHELPLGVEFVTDVAGFDQLEQVWTELAAAQGEGEPTFFQSFAWCRHVAGVRQVSNGGRYKPLLAVVRRGDAVAGLWPLSIQWSLTAWIARNLDHPFGQFGGLLVRYPADADKAIAAVLAGLRLRKGIDGAHIDCVPAGSALHAGLTRAGLKRESSNTAPWLDFRPFATFEAYKDTRNKKSLKNLRNALNRLERTGAVAFETTHERAVVARTIEDSFAGRVEWLNQRGKSSTAFRSQDFARLIAGLPEQIDIDLISFRMTLDGRTIASQWGFVHDATYYAYISSRDQAFDDFSVGRLHLSNVVEQCYRRGLRAIEFMPPSSDYKLQWTDQTRTLDAFSTSFNAAGRIDLDILTKHILPGLKSAGRRLPMSIRRRLTSLVNRKG